MLSASFDTAIMLPTAWRSNCTSIDLKDPSTPIERIAALRLLGDRVASYVPISYLSR